MSAISIKKGPIDLAGLLFKPSKASGKTAGLVLVHPGGGVKEQTASTYARKLADAGFTTIAYDASYQGGSGGEPHFLEDPNERVSDVYAVVDYLQKLDTVDENRIGVLGICAGGGYAVGAAKGDHRLKAVATISMVNIGDASRLGWNGGNMNGLCPAGYYLAQRQSLWWKQISRTRWTRCNLGRRRPKDARRRAIRGEP